MTRTEVDVVFNIQASRARPGRDPRARRGRQGHRGLPRAVALLLGRSEEQLVVIRDTPRLSDTLLTCLAGHRVRDAGQSCSRDRQAGLKPTRCPGGSR